MEAIHRAGGNDPKLRAGTSGLRRANWALFAGGFATFALLYCVQPLLPTLAVGFQVGAATSSLALSMSTGFMAASMLVVSSVADSCGRKSVMGWSLALASALGLATAVAPGWGAFLALRALMGLALAGLPAVAMAYLSEEVEAGSLGVAMGLYISGNAVGGMSGRLLAGILTDYFSWRVALGVIGLLAVAAAVLFWIALPASRHFRARRLETGVLCRSLVRHLRETGLQKLFAIGFVLMGCFVTVYNYIGFRLMAAPYNMRQSVLAGLFTIYLIGVFSSIWAGRIAGRVGRRRVLWWTPALILAGTGLTLFSSLVAIVAGIALVTAGFFAGHSVASSWIGRRAEEARAQASGVYLLFYYAGGSIVGWLGGHAWTAWQWPGVAALVGILALLGVVLAWSMRSLPRLSLVSVPETEPAEPAG